MRLAEFPAYLADLRFGVVAFALFHHKPQDCETRLEGGGRRDSGGIQEGFRRDSGGIQEGFRRDSGGIQEGFRRDSGGIELEYSSNRWPCGGSAEVSAVETCGNTG
jgi:hypothetical protein